MYCSSCGVAVAAGLSYCNYCGAKLGGGKTDDVVKSPEVKPGSLIGAMVCTFVFGLAGITFLIGMMRVVVRLEVGLILAFTLLCFLIMLALESVFILLLLRRNRGAEGSGAAVRLPGQSTNELDAAHARALPEPMPSVTEHTTRAFEPVYRERSSGRMRDEG
jgi:hypothetical protein